MGGRSENYVLLGGRYDLRIDRRARMKLEFEVPVVDNQHEVIRGNRGRHTEFI